MVRNAFKTVAEEAKAKRPRGIIKREQVEKYQNVCFF